MASSSPPSAAADPAPGPPRSIARRVLRGVAELVGMVFLAGLIMVVVGRLRAPSLPDQAPDFSLPDLQGRTVSLSDLKGRVVVLNFWATWCGPCRLEIPSFSAYADKHPDVVLLGVAMDGTPAQLAAASKKLGISYPVLLADAATIAAYGVTTLPTTVVVDPDGRVSSAHAGLMLGPQLSLAVSAAD